MSDVSILDASQLPNHELRKFVEKTTQLLKLNAVQAINSRVNNRTYRLAPTSIEVGGAQRRSYPSVEYLVAKRFDALPAEVQRAAARDIGGDASITESIRTFAIDVRSERPALDQIDVTSHFSFVNEQTFGEDRIRTMATELRSVVGDGGVPATEALHRELTSLNIRYGSLVPGLVGILGSIRPGDGGGGTIVVNRGLRFRVHEVKCIDETNPEWLGHDEIAWGGAAVDDKGESTKIPEYYVGGGFDDGDHRSYSPPRVVHTFHFGDSVYPKTFLVTLALAEKDSGGLSQFIEQLYQAIKAHVTTILAALGAAAGAAIGTAVGGSIGTAIGGPLGTIIGIAAGAILGALIGWLISALKDDIFAPQASSLTFDSASDSFAGGGLVSPALYFHYRDHGGHYRVRYDWEITR